MEKRPGITDFELCIWLFVCMQKQLYFSTTNKWAGTWHAKKVVANFSDWSTKNAFQYICCVIYVDCLFKICILFSLFNIMHRIVSSFRNIVIFISIDMQSNQSMDSKLVYLFIHYHAFKSSSMTECFRK